MIGTMRVEVEIEVWNNVSMVHDPGYQTFEDVADAEVSETGVLILSDADHAFIAAYSANSWVAVYQVPDEV